MRGRLSGWRARGWSRRPPLPLRPGTRGGVAATGAALACAEFVRSGLYAAYLPQASAGLLGLPKAEAVAAAAAALTVHFLADTLMRGPAGALIARRGVRLPLLAGAALSLGALALLPLAHHPATLLLMAALHGVGFSVMWPAAMNLTAEAARPGHQGRALTLLSVGVMPLIGAGVLVLGALAGGGGLTVPLLVLGVQAAALLAALGAPGRLGGAVDGRAAAPARPATRVRAVWRPLAPLLPGAFMQTLTLTLLGPLLFTLFPELGLGYWGMVGVLAVGGAAALGSFPLTGRIADGGHARLSVTLGFTLIGAALGLLATTPPVAALYALAALAGLGYAFVMPGWAALVTGTLPAAERPAAWGVLMTVENAGTALGPLVGALAYRQLGVPGPFLTGAALALLTATGYVVFRRAFARAADARPA
ncbi:MFS transporter [Deinococcus budaensis]|uniref:MFS family permease n=1 Tax=Deinococcus budaensis TaxID=1665626 RepID=A0A7W8GHB5_9DEIO|nr:MFS transporter [Deinococcus budaensis]MBB5235238.1 MFS family permease [Deinococcus budaensis]